MTCGKAMDLSPMKVLLVHRGEPFPFPRIGSSSLVPPFVFLQLAWPGPEEGPRPLPVGYSVYVLPCSVFHELRVQESLGLCLVYGEPDDALSCLEGGAVDFLREGWNLHELAARLYRIWRPELRTDRGILRLRGELLEFEPREKGGMTAQVDLTPQGAALLRVLLAHRGKAVPAAILRSSVGAPEGSGALPMRISRLRSRMASLEGGLARRLRSCGLGAYLLDVEAETKD